MTASSINREIVIRILENVANKSKDMSITVDGDEITIVKGGRPEVNILPSEVPKKMLHRFARIYGIKIESFYHPNMLFKQDIKQ